MSKNEIHFAVAIYSLCFCSAVLTLFCYKIEAISPVMAYISWAIELGIVVGFTLHFILYVQGILQYLSDFIEFSMDNCYVKKSTEDYSGAEIIVLHHVMSNWTEIEFPAKAMVAGSILYGWGADGAPGKFIDGLKVLEPAAVAKCYEYIDYTYRPLVLLRMKTVKFSFKFPEDDK